MPKPTLHYHFEAEYHDGTIFRQDENDHSIKFAPTIDANGQPQGKSSFSDIQEDVLAGNIRRFSLVGKGNRLTVDLKLGVFYINGLPLLVESKKLPRAPKFFELIYYRQNTVNQNVTYDTKTGQILEAVTDQNIFTEHFIGWKCNINGKEYQEKIAVA